MPQRFISKNILQFSIAGRPICRGNTGISPRETGGGGGFNGGKGTYELLTRISAKTAMLEQGFPPAMDDEQGIYIALVVYLGNGAKRTTDKLKRIKDGTLLPTRDPSIPRLLNVISKALEGLVYKKTSQIVGSFVVKQYITKRNDEQRVDVLIGSPTDVRELLYDLRNI